jgi:hypothetical protein
LLGPFLLATFGAMAGRFAPQQNVSTHVGSGSWSFQNALPEGPTLDEGGDASRFSDFPTLPTS